MDTYIVYRVKFQPGPTVQNSMHKFNSEEDARNHINASQSINNNHWFIIKQKNGHDVGELIDIIPKF